MARSDAGLCTQFARVGGKIKISSLISLFKASGSSDLGRRILGLPNSKELRCSVFCDHYNLVAMLRKRSRAVWNYIPAIKAHGVGLMLETKFPTIAV